MLPFQPVINGWAIPVHMILEYLGFFLGFGYYRHLKSMVADPISSDRRMLIIFSAAGGAFLGSRIIGFLEYPVWPEQNALLILINLKSIMGGLFGGLLAVEASKWFMKERNSSGDLFTLPIIVGIFIGRIGCFLAGTSEFTYGKVTDSWVGMNLGDGLNRHPIALYELIFLVILFLVLRMAALQWSQFPGMLFKVFMLAYFGFRFLMEFLKPNEYFNLGLSSIQWLCIICYLYYLPFIIKIFYAR